MRHGNEKLASEYLDAEHSHPLVLAMPVTSSIAQHVAQLRAQFSLKTADAIQLATALTHKATAFVTNDRGFGRIAGIEILNLRELTS